jgi:hypothetical protein
MRIKRIWIQLLDRVQQMVLSVRQVRLPLCNPLGTDAQRTERISL